MQLLTEYATDNFSFQIAPVSRVRRGRGFLSKPKAFRLPEQLKFLFLPLLGLRLPQTWNHNTEHQNRNSIRAHERNEAGC